MLLWHSSFGALTAKKRKRAEIIPSGTRCDAFTAGGIIALLNQGYPRREIVASRAVTKPDGSDVDKNLVGRIVRQLEADKVCARLGRAGCE